VSILEISQMIDLIEDHFSPTWGRNHVLTVGGIAGTDIFKIGLGACMKYHDFAKILVVDGCQDYIGLLRKPVTNYIYYMDLFRSVRIPAIEQQLRPMHKFPMELKSGYQMALVDAIMCGYDALIINNAHLIPSTCRKAMADMFPGYILEIIDPLDFNGSDFHAVHTLYDSLSKQSPLIAMARSLFGVESRAIDRKVRGDFKKVKMTKRSIGKIDANQYVTNSYDVLNQIQNKQYNSQFRRNQKFIVASEEIRMMNDQNGKPVIVGPGTMFSISTASKPLMKLRIHSSTRQVYSTLSYQYTEQSLYVKPANILMADDACHHRFNSVVIVLGEEPMTNRLWYSLFKIANTITIVDF